MILDSESVLPSDSVYISNHQPRPILPSAGSATKVLLPFLYTETTSSEYPVAFVALDINVVKVVVASPLRLAGATTELASTISIKRIFTLLTNQIRLERAKCLSSGNNFKSMLAMPLMPLVALVPPNRLNPKLRTLEELPTGLLQI